MLSTQSFWENSHWNSLSLNSVRGRKCNTCTILNEEVPLTHVVCKSFWKQPWQSIISGTITEAVWCVLYKWICILGPLAVRQKNLRQINQFEIRNPQRTVPIILHVLVKYIKYKLCNCAHQKLRNCWPFSKPYFQFFK